MNSRLDYIGDATGIICTAVQSNELLQWISFAITIIATLVSLALSIYQWYKSAKSDNKITADEVEELHEIMKSSKDKIDDITKKGRE